MDTWSLTKKPKPYNGKKTISLTNGASLTGSLHVEECKLIHIYHLVQRQVKVDQGHQHKTSYSESNRKENGK